MSVHQCVNGKQLIDKNHNQGSRSNCSAYYQVYQNPGPQLWLLGGHENYESCSTCEAACAEAARRAGPPWRRAQCSNTKCCQVCSNKPGTFCMPPLVVKARAAGSRENYHAAPQQNGSRENYSTAGYFIQSRTGKSVVLAAGNLQASVEGDSNYTLVGGASCSPDASGTPGFTCVQAMIPA